jgi:hypothetical protein
MRRMFGQRYSSAPSDASRVNQCTTVASEKVRWDVMRCGETASDGTLAVSLVRAFTETRMYAQA